ncbi:MAG: type III-B CRISPR module-associated protein Cmr5 [Desulfobacteraceae bacterium]|jgi:CRISPR/Cas system CMR-associated protein Cmr5 small subunit|nr:type III-B CRISPR module-associated protein Cmr5 [Desulfobacteraceae bacterium]
MQSKSQIYSDIVFDKIQKFIEKERKEHSVAEHAERKDSEFARKYKALNKRSGGLLRTVGLIQFLTFLAAKATKEKEKHHGDLLEHLRDELFKLNIVRAQNTDEFLHVVRRQELPEYMRTTSEILKLLQWHKRISDILISGTAEGD